MSACMKSSKIRTVGEYIEAMRDSDRIIIQVSRSGLAIPAGRFFAFNPKNLNDSEQMILEALSDVEVEELRFEQPVLNV